MNIYFYNGFHNGDLHVSRTFVRYVMKNIKAKNYYYCHIRSPKVLIDIDGLNQITESKSFFNENNPKGYFKIGENYYINTWYGAYNFEYLKKHEMTILVLFNIFKRTLKELFNHEITEHPLLFLPSIDYSKLNLSIIDDFLSKEKRKKVLLCNNNVESGQSENFNFDNIIKTLSEKYPDIYFIVSNIFNDYIIERQNVSYCNIILPDKYENNLNEISYLSKFCDVVIGRYSGPQTFSGTFDNLLDSNKTWITFVRKGDPNGYSFGDCSFGVSSFLPEGKRAKFISSTDFTENNVISIIEGELK